MFLFFHVPHTTRPHQQYLLIFAESVIAWNTRTHKLGFEVGHKNEPMATAIRCHSSSFPHPIAIFQLQWMLVLFGHFHGWKLCKIIHMYQRSCSLHNQCALQSLGAPRSCGHHGHQLLFWPCMVWLIRILWHQIFWWARKITSLELTNIELEAAPKTDTFDSFFLRIF